MKIRITHLAVELNDCQCDLADAKFVKRALERSIKQTRLTPLHSYFHNFAPCGTTGVILLKESHIAIHTWPEHRYASVDVVTCGRKSDAARAVRALVKNFRPRRVRRQEIRRGTHL
ncbi:MAG TPA: adenosylmethionine decarboxylase [Candidatus Acidoferrales bacterium]|nr:adenosylmethionine decarboxylase [Candidatus Acidoferrales bacterium]